MLTSHSSALFRASPHQVARQGQRRLHQQGGQVFGAGVTDGIHRDVQMGDLKDGWDGWALGWAGLGVVNPGGVQPKTSQKTICVYLFFAMMFRGVR